MATLSTLLSSVSSGIRSGIAAPNLGQCIEELVVNSLDAYATDISVEYDSVRLDFKVTDNGHGFSEDNLRKAGIRYSTSKCSTKIDIDENLHFYGFRGEALASIAYLSNIVEITSRESGANKKFYKIVEQGKNQEIRVLPCDIGYANETSVAVKGLYKDLPVRRYGLNVELESEAISERIKRISITHPSTSFVLINTSKPGFDFRVPKHKSCLSRFQFVFGHIPPINFMNEISSHEPEYQISGAISRHGFDNKNLQFVFVNRRPVLKTRIHKEISEILKKSDIGNRKEVSTEVQRNNIQKMRNSDYPVKIITKRTYGIYFINIMCSHRKYDISFEPEKTMIEFKNWNQVLAVALSTIMRFLNENNLLLAPRKVDKEEDCQNRKLDGSLKLPTAGDILPHDAAVFSKMAQNKNTISSASTSKFSVVNRSSKLSDISNSIFSDQKSSHAIENKLVSSIITNPEGVSMKTLKSNWISKYNAKLGRNVYINVTTGMSTENDPKLTDAPEITSIGLEYEFKNCEREFAPIPKEERPKFGCHYRKSNKIEISHWENPAIPIKAKISDHLDKRTFSSLFSSSDISMKFDKDIFQRLQIIGQLDNKFIVTLLSPAKTGTDDETITDNEKSTIVLFDQHAVHERIRLERLEKDIQSNDGIKSATLKNEISIHMRESECTLMEAWKNKFAKIGLQYRTEDNRDNTVLRITAVPAPLLTKVERFHKENEKQAELSITIQRLIREQLQVLRETSGASYSIPKCIFDILCSQACHGAIRFGDRLSLSQGEELLKFLSACQLPFQCAHGRPTLTPICFQTSIMRNRCSKPNLQRLKKIFK
ncbi:uncharacterized protein LOC120326763 [Styela clava]